MIVERKNTRGRIEILASILLHCREGIKKTHIMSKANVGYEQICYYVPNLIKTDLLAQAIENGSVIYRTTNRGRQFLKSYFEITKLLVTSENSNLGGSELDQIGSGISSKYDNEEERPLIAVFEETGL